MAKFRIRCKLCRGESDLISPLGKKPEKTCSCGGEMVPVPIQSSLVQAGDDWVGKGMVLRSQFARMRERIDSREHFTPQLQPNVEGERVDSWQEAARLAKSKGFDPKPFEDLAIKQGEA